MVSSGWDLMFWFMHFVFWGIVGFDSVKVDFDLSIVIL